MTKKILVVDDDREICELLVELLTDEGYQAEAVFKSLQVFDTTKEFRPDLVLMDIMMPYLDGWDQLKLYSLDGELKQIPVIVITADQSAFHGVANIGEWGITGFLFKPFDSAALIAMIEGVFKR